MGRKGQLTEYERGHFDVFAAQGVSASQIAAAIDRSRKPISSYLRDPDAYGRRFSPGRPRKMSPRDCRRVVRATHQETLSSSEIKEQLQLTISSRTVRRFLNSTELFMYVTMNKAPKLTDAHHKARIE
ncbi:hypothetical protein PRIC1_000250 [Phytophthora ramorum]